MQRTLSAIFDNHRDAEAAIAELVLSGFSREAIRLATGDPSGADGPLTGEPAPAAPAAPAGPAAPASSVGGVGNFLQTLFATDDSEHVQNIVGAVTHGHLVLTLRAVDLIEIERAAAIVERYGPVEIEAASAAAGAGPLSQLQAEPPGRAGHAAPVHHGHHRPELAGHEAAWRRHHAETYGTDECRTRQALDEAAPYPGDEHYDEYAPAYLYGLDMASHEQHGGKEWEEAEPALRSGWEARHPQSAWSKFKEAVRHSWERLRKDSAS